MRLYNTSCLYERNLPIFFSEVRDDDAVASTCMDKFYKTILSSCNNSNVADGFAVSPSCEKQEISGSHLSKVNQVTGMCHVSRGSGQRNIFAVKGCHHQS